MRVTLIIHALGGGGAERVMSIIANYWASQRWDITLIVLVDPTEPSFYHLDPRIELKSLGVAEDSANLFMAIANTWRRVKTLRREIVASKPDVTISFMNSVNVYNIWACWNLNIPTIVSEHTYPGANDAGRIWQFLMKKFYRYADVVTVLTQNAVPFYPPASGYQTIVMPNPIATPEPDISIERLLPTPSLISVGRLDPRKGFDLLFRAFDQIRDRHPDWQLTILGEGEIRSELEQLRSELKLEDCVHLPGAVKNVSEYLHQADLFVMSSRVEGFPMALCEAMACGLATITTDCLSGPSDIINSGVNGLLVPSQDVNALAMGLDALMSDPVKRQQLAQNAPQVLDRFGLEQVMVLWSEAVEQAISHRKSLQFARSSRSPFASHQETNEYFKN